MAKKNASTVGDPQDSSTRSIMLDLNQPLPLLPLRDSLVLPGTSSRVLVGRHISLRAIREAESHHEGTMLLVLQRDSAIEDVKLEDLQPVGVVAHVLQVSMMPNGYCKVLFEGLFAADIREVRFNDEKKLDYLIASATPRDFYFDTSDSAQERARNVLEEFRKYAGQTDLPADLFDSLNEADVPLQIYFGIVPFLKLSIEEKQKLLEVTSVSDVADKVEGALQALQDVDALTRKMQSEVQRKAQQQQRDWLISEQIRLLQNELSTDDSTDSKVLEAKIKAKRFPAEIQEKLDEEISRMRLMPVASPEYALIRNYLDWFVNLPYGVYTDTELNLKTVKKTLDARHFGLDKVKERILEYIAVLKLNGTDRKAPVLCLVGPPGVGKTTLVSSVAKALGREYVRVTLGGVRDEAEIRGHRKTYIGAMPGRFVQALRRAKCMNPVILLDEIDKMASDFRGDPASALLELLDPEQNHCFSDHFMEVGIDFSKVMFIATANTEQDIPAALHDRLEIVRLPGYYKHEKLSIAENYLLPEVTEASGVKLGKDIEVPTKLVEKIIADYTREAGVRELGRLLEKIARSRAKEIVLGKKVKPEVTEAMLTQYLGAPRFTSNRLPAPGVYGRVTGLAWTSVGGEILSIECMLLSGRGQVILTGKLGDVMKESIQIAISLVRERLRRYGIDPALVRKTDIHVHVPEGATPKDGPSAGIAMTLAILSAFTQIPIDPAIAFTGEVSLTGDLLPIGGLNEKALAAQESGVKTLYIPVENGKDVEELPEPAKKNLKINLMKHIDEIIKILLPVKKKVEKAAAEKPVAKKARKTKAK